MSYRRFRFAFPVLCAVLSMCSARKSSLSKTACRLALAQSTGWTGTDQGWSVAISADGNTALVGGPKDDNTIGAVWVFTQDSNGNWSRQGDKLVGAGPSDNGWVGAARFGVNPKNETAS